MQWYMCGRDDFLELVFFSTLENLAIEFKMSGLVASAFIPWAILLAWNTNFKFIRLYTGWQYVLSSF